MSLINKAISYVSPQWALHREIHQMNLDFVKQLGKANYNGAQYNRHDKVWMDYSGQDPIRSNPLAEGDGWQRKQSVQRAKELCRNDGIASGILQRAVENIVGNGFNLNAETSDPIFNKQVETLWEEWVDTADMRGLSWLEHQGLACTSWLRDGDCGTYWTNTGNLQTYTSEYINTPIDQKNNINIVDGVLINNYGTPLKYYVDSWDGVTKKDKSIEIDAANFIFLANLKEFSHYRGETVFMQTFSVFDQLKQWQMAGLHAAKLQAFMAFAITNTNKIDELKASPIHPPVLPSMLQGQTLPASPTPPAPTQEQLYRQRLEGMGENTGREQKWESGQVKYLNPGDDIKGIQSTQPASNFSENFKLNVRTLGLEIGLPLELLLLDFSQGNFSSQRIALLQAQRAMKRRQHLFTTNYLSKIYKLRVQKWIDEERLKKPPEDKFAHRFIATPWAYLDPVADLQAKQMSLDLGEETLTSLLAAQGKDFEQYIDVRSQEIAKLKTVGIPLLHAQQFAPYNSQEEPTPTKPIDTTKPLIDDGGEND